MLGRERGKYRTTRAGICTYFVRATFRMERSLEIRQDRILSIVRGGYTQWLPLSTSSLTEELYQRVNKRKVFVCEVGLADVLIALAFWERRCGTRSVVGHGSCVTDSFLARQVTPVS
ncbi:hypothetical protein RRG08_010343 [Elysia crispata]|uniref:Uncharacterized protein n=1 Tax=Elysia crispata TaxID=231223 RepID=A0AAE1AZS8_9GAST|nr:hypothetical protein RRG08_010343 [Elysia crispata]